MTKDQEIEIGAHIHAAFMRAEPDSLVAQFAYTAWAAWGQVAVAKGIKVQDARDLAHKNGWIG